MFRFLFDSVRVFGLPHHDLEQDLALPGCSGAPAHRDGVIASLHVVHVVILDAVFLLDVLLVGGVARDTRVPGLWRDVSMEGGIPVPSAGRGNLGNSL